MISYRLYFIVILLIAMPTGCILFRNSNPRKLTFITFVSAQNAPEKLVNMSRDNRVLAIVRHRVHDRHNLDYMFDDTLHDTFLLFLENDAGHRSAWKMRVDDQRAVRVELDRDGLPVEFWPTERDADGRVVKASIPEAVAE